MSFKFFGKNQNYESLVYSINEHMGFIPTRTFTLNEPIRFNPDAVEFCFQFQDDEPVVFATGPNELHIRLNPTEYENITFNNNGRVFKLFARERDGGVRA